jgi:hypothetical protein
VTFKQVAYPAAITAKRGCVRANDSIDETPTGDATVPTYTAGSGGGSATTSASGRVGRVPKLGLGQGVVGQRRSMDSVMGRGGRDRLFV